MNNFLNTAFLAFLNMQLSVFSSIRILFYFALEWDIKNMDNQLSNGTMRWQSKFQFFNYYKALFISRKCSYYVLRQQTGSRSSRSTHLRDHLWIICKRMLSISTIVRSYNCVAHERSRKRKRLLIMRRGPRVSICVYVCVRDCPRQGYGSSLNASAIES